MSSGSATDRWHNILRTGLDFSEIACGRAYGNGVYFANEALTSMQGYSKATTPCRLNADWIVSKATALVELVNVPETFVSRSPYYVVANVNQIKPFLLLVEGSAAVLSTASETTPPPVKSEPELFKHDPTIPVTFCNKPLILTMPEKLRRTTFIDDDPNHPDEEALFNPPTTISTFTPSPASRFERLQLMPPPSETSVTASRALGREFKGIVGLQEKGELPFYIDPESDSLYCWLLELHDFPASRLKDDMKKYGVWSIIAEMRFPASFPHSAPFMRVLHPRCLPFSQGGGGNITAGGSVCNEILTASGWNPAFCIEAIVRDIMTNMVDATPPARLDPRSWDHPYNLNEAVEAFKRVAGQHGWEIPKDFDKMAR